MKRGHAGVWLFVVVAASIFPVIAPTPAGADTPSPVVLIMMENHSFGPTDPGVADNTTRYIVGNPDAPYINGTLIPEGTLYTRYDALGPVSLPNYLDLTSGGGWGCATDDCPQDAYPEENLFDLLGQAGVPFRSYIEPMPHNCKTGTRYASLEHNPEVFYSDIDAASGLTYGCPVTDVPLPHPWPNPLPGFSFVAPSNCHNMHGSGKVGTCPSNLDADVTAGDTWLSQNVPALLALGATVVVTFDEGASLDLTGGGGHVATIVVGPDVGAGVSNDTPEDHFGLLAGLERHFGLGPLLAGAATATPMQLPDGPTPAAPAIAAVTPSAGATGTDVQITGTDLGTASSVRFGVTPAAFTIPSDEELDTSVPPGASAGPITVLARGGSASAPFEVDLSGPTLLQHAGAPGLSPAPSATLSAPTSSGDLLVATIAWKAGATLTAPQGWTPLKVVTGLGIYVWPDAPSQTPTFTFALSASAHWAMQVSEWTGVATTDVTASATSGGALGTAASTGTTAAAAGSGELVVGAIVGLGNVSESAPSGGFATTDVVSDPRAVTLGVFWSITASADPQGTSVTLSIPAKWRGAVAAFR